MLQFGSTKGRNMDRVRVIRGLEYEGPRKWVEDTLAAPHAIKGTATFNGGTCFIREAIVGDFPVVVEETRKVEKLTDQEIKFMTRFGWDLDMNPATKYDIETGKVLAREGDETWDRDLKVAGE